MDGAGEEAVCAAAKTGRDQAHDNHQSCAPDRRDQTGEGHRNHLKYRILFNLQKKNACHWN